VLELDQVVVRTALAKLVIKFGVVLFCPPIYALPGVTDGRWWWSAIGKRLHLNVARTTHSLKTIIL
jgi:hypothetical protein